MRLSLRRTFQLTLAVYALGCGATSHLDTLVEGPDELRPYAAVTVHATVNPATVAAGRHVLLSLTLRSTRTTTVDVALRVTKPDGSSGPSASWTSRKLVAGTPLVLEESLLVATADPLGIYSVGAHAKRSGSTLVYFNESVGNFTVVSNAVVDTEPPSVPRGQTISAITSGGFSMGWNASTDNVGVTGYRIWLDNVHIATTTSLSYAYTGLACAHTYLVGLEAVDAAGNVSHRPEAQGHVTTAACTGGDTTPPAAPQGLRVSSATATSLTLSWSASIEEVAGYGVYRNGTLVATTTASSYVLSGLTCATAYTVEVDAVDAANNRSAKVTVNGTTSACPANTGNVISFAGTVTASTFIQAINAAPAGAVIVEPASGHATFTVSGAVTLTRANVAINRAVFTNVVTFSNTSHGSSMSDSKLLGADIRGADDILWQRNSFDGECRVAQNFIMDQPAGVVPQRFRIINNTFRNYHYCADTTVHTEALFIGYSDGGLIEGNLFEDNGNTAHIFFTWWGSTANPETSYARNICVRGNTFRRAINGYFSTQIRGEIPASSNISVDPDNISDRHLIGNSDGIAYAFIRDC